MDKRISISTIIGIVLLALLLSLSYGPVAHAQTQTNSTTSGSTLMITSTIPLTSNSDTTASTTASYASTMASTSLGATTNTTTSTSNVSNSTSTASMISTSTSTESNSTTFTETSKSEVTVTMTSLASTTTTMATLATSTSTSDPAYSISFGPAYWLCTNVFVTFTGPLVESGYYGDTLQFQYYQYASNYPSVLTPIFTDSGLTVTSDTVSYWVNYNEYAPVNFAYMPNLAVKVVDITPKSNGYTPGLIFMQLTSIAPEGAQYCQYDAPTPTPEFQAQWLVIMPTVVLSLLLLRAHKHSRSPRRKNQRNSSKHEPTAHYSTT